MSMPLGPAMFDELHTEIHLARVVHRAAQAAHEHSPNGETEEAARVAEADLNELLERLLNRRMRPGPR